jgi:hypothetical protein
VEGVWVCCATHLRWLGNHFASLQLSSRIPHIRTASSKLQPKLLLDHAPPRNLEIEMCPSVLLPALFLQAAILSRVRPGSFTTTEQAGKMGDYELVFRARFASATIIILDARR